MNKFKIKWLTIVSSAFMALLSIWSTAFAHHATQGYTSGEAARITVSGVVREFRWANPHTQIYLDETLANGETRTWGFEMNSPGNLIRRGGWAHNSLKAGEQAIATFNPAVNPESYAGACLTIKLVASDTTLHSGQGCSGYDNTVE